MEQPTTLRELLQTELPKLYAFAYQVSGQQDEALQFTQELCRQVAEQDPAAILGHSHPERALLSLISRNIEQNLGRKTEHTFDSLDELLRSDITRPIDLRTAAGVEDNPQRVHGLLWELKRTCLGAVLGCLPPGVRLSFVLTDLMGYQPPDAAAILDIKESAYRVRLTRARKRIEDYLTPRCHHVDAQNPCSCPGRLMIALDAGFIQNKDPEIAVPPEGHDEGGPRRDVGSLYRSLPQVSLTDHQLASLLPA